MFFIFGKGDFEEMLLGDYNIFFKKKYNMLFNKRKGVGDNFSKNWVI